MRLVALCLVTGLAVSCSSFSTKEIPASQFKNYGANPMTHTAYVGSDATYHYFAWEQGKSSGRWKIRKTEMPFSNEFPVSSGRSAFMRRDEQGRWQPD